MLRHELVILMRSIRDIIQRLEEIEQECKEAKYSIDTAHSLFILADEIRLHGKQVMDCCY